MNANDFLDKQLGVRTYEDDTVMNATMNGTVQQIVSGNPGALTLQILNIGTADMYVWHDQTVSTSKGFLVPASGGILILDWQKFFLLASRPWYGVTAGNSTQIAAIRNVILGS